MPTYVYRFVKTGETIEVQQSFNEDTLTEVVHPRSGRKMAVKKVFTPVGVTFRGDGFYKTDSRSTKTSKPATSKADSAGDSGGATSSDSSTSKSTTSPTSESSASSSKKSDANATAAP